MELLNPNRLPSSNNNKDLLRYAGLGSQLLVAIAIAVFIGFKADRWLHTSPVLACVLPLLVLTGIFYKLMRETSGRRRDQSGADETTKPGSNKKENDTK